MNEASLIPMPQAMTKAAIAQRGAELADAILENGDISPLEALVKLRAIQDVVAAAIDGVKDEAMTQAEQWDEGHGRGASILGVGVRLTSGAAKWDYSHDAAWVEAKASETAVANQRKAREKFLQQLPQEMVDPETGEFIRPAEQLSLGNRTIALTFPRQ